MPGRTPNLKLLETRKQLLLAESEVNREEFSRELDHLRGEFRQMKENARMAGTIATAATFLGTTASAIHRHFHSPEQPGSNPKRSWIASAIDHARVGTALFLKIRSLFRDGR